MKKRIILKEKTALMVLILCALMVFMAGCGSNSTAADEITNVKTASAKVSSIQIDVEYACKLKPLNEIAISPKMSGKIAAISADVGQGVKKGQTLFTLDASDIDAQYKQAEAGLDAANANLARTSDSALSQQIIQADAAVRQAQVQYDDARNYYSKTKQLYDSGAASKQQLDDADSKQKSAGIQLDSANENLKLLKDKAGPQSVNVASAQVEQAQASVNLADSQVKNTVVTSPIDGIVSVKNIEEGEMASNAVPAFVVINASTLIAEINVPDTTAVKVHKDQKLDVKVDTLKDRTFTGTVQSVSPAADSRTQLYAIKIKIDNSDNSIKAGMFTRVILPQEKKDDIITVPNEAIVVESGVQYVYTVVDGKIVKKIVSTGLSDNKNTEIVSGLNEGEKVVIEGQSFLDDGEKVKIEN